MRSEWGPVGTPNQGFDATARSVKAVIEQLKAEEFQLLVYQGKNSKLIVLSRGEEVHLIGEAQDG